MSNVLGWGGRLGHLCEGTDDLHGLGRILAEVGTVLPDAFQHLLRLLLLSLVRQSLQLDQCVKAGGAGREGCHSANC